MAKTINSKLFLMINKKRGKTRVLASHFDLCSIPAQPAHGKISLKRRRQR